MRIVFENVVYLSYDSPPEYPSDDEPDWEAYDQARRAWDESRQVELPEPKNSFSPTPVTVDLCDKFGERGLQVIVKLANIELTPEKPNYEGGTWHVEGQMVRTSNIITSTIQISPS